MIDLGMNCCRLNFSHGDHASHGKTVDVIKEAMRQRKDTPVSIMLDTKGPEIRTGFLQDKKPVDLVKGQSLEITTDYSFLGNKDKIACSYEKLPQSVAPGNCIL